MTSIYPDDIDVFATVPVATRQVAAIGGRTHRQHHNDLGDAAETLEAEVGVRGSGLAGTGPLVNSGFDVWQAGTTFTGIANAAWGPDNWIYRKAGAVVHDLLQSSDLPTVAQAKLRATNSLHLDVTTADTSLASGDFCTIATRIEGYGWRLYDQQVWSIGFWVKASKTGRHYVYATNSGEDRSCVSAYDVGAANTWEYHTVMFPLNPTAGTWNYDAGRGVEIGWCLAAGATYQASAALTWQSGLLFGMSDQVNELDNTANNFRVAMVGRPTLTGAGAAAPARYRPAEFDVELQRCQRYYEKSYDYGALPGSVVAAGEVIGQASGAIAASTAGSLYLPSAPMFMATKRVAPTVVLYAISPATANAVQIGGTLVRAGSVASGPSQSRPWDQIAIDNTNASAIADRATVQCQWTAAARIP